MKRNTETLVKHGQESLQRAQSGGSLRNDVQVIVGFAERGIEAKPRVDVFTFAGWIALGRRVRKGEHGVKISTVITRPKRDKETGEAAGEAKLLRTVTVFHVTQTEAAQ